ncbi:L-fuconolactonase [Paramicrobacterium humi]|uniref:L-fuconolactonase n=1 Tax=Paramicrobacterium humi TaxID=640635 RepID=A0A1H4LYD5_9MICO|nr:amidohydrolase family protein [Microbacterium humi]SEB75598.1 L-fuconolactonase [Microbacterium humi]
MNEMTDAALAVPRGQRIDAHMHLWNLAEGRYAWLTPEFGTLYASWTPEQAKPELDAAGMAGAVLVQAEDSLADTRFMLDVAAQHPWVLGVVGWVDLTDPDAAVAPLDEWQRSSAFCGIRHLLNDDPRRDLLGRPAVIETLAEVGRRGLAFDVHDSWPDFLDDAAAVARALPELTLVIDHLGKPPRGSADFADWKAAIAHVAEYPNVVGKLSSLRRAGQDFTPDALRETWDHALACFGSERLMYGGDWPMPVPDGGYAPTWAVMAELIAQLSSPEQWAVLHDTAARVYSLDALASTRKGN